MELKTEQKKNQVVVTMTFDKPEWDAATESAYKKTAGKYKLPGFRAGKAPRKMIEQQYGAGVFAEDAIHALFTTNFEKYLKDNPKLRLVDYPKLDFDFTKDGGIKLVATVDLEPEVKLGKYTGLEIEKTKVNVGDKEVDEYITRMREMRAKQVSADKGYKIAKGDIAVINFKGSVGGKYFDGGTADNHELVIGSNSFIDNFEDQLVGLKAGDEKDVIVTFPKDYGVKELAGAKAKFETKVVNILKKILPEVDDQFAKEVSEFETLAEFKKDVKTKMQEHATKQAELTDDDKLFEAVAKGATVDITDAMVEKQLDGFMEEMEQKLAVQGANVEMYAQYMGKTVDDLRNEQRDMAAKHVKLRLVIDAIIEKEKLFDKDRQKQFDKLCQFLREKNKFK